MAKLFPLKCEYPVDRRAWVIQCILQNKYVIGSIKYAITRSPS